MTCPACGEVLNTGQERCSFCGAVVSPPVEGSLAPQPSLITPPPGARAEPVRELPSLRKREKTWKDEVSERMRHRRHKRAGHAELPLFREGAPTPEAAAPAEEVVEEAEAPAAPPVEELRELERPDLGGSATPDLPLRATLESADLDWEGAAAARMDLDETPLGQESHQPEPQPEPEARPPAAHPPEIKAVERPARFAERARAGGLDFSLLTALAVIVVYFASRAAHVPVLGLRPNWPYLAAYIAFLGLAYAVYFTGTTGQTPGKMAAGLRVVDISGRPPGYARAMLRAVLGAGGMLAAGLGLLPMLFDPARRALHDRLLRTRVVKG